MRAGSGRRGGVRGAEEEALAGGDAVRRGAASARDDPRKQRAAKLERNGATGRGEHRISKRLMGMARFGSGEGVTQRRKGAKLRVAEAFREMESGWGSEGRRKIFAASKELYDESKCHNELPEPRAWAVPHYSPPQAATIQSGVMPPHSRSRLAGARRK